MQKQLTALRTSPPRNAQAPITSQSELAQAWSQKVLEQDTQSQLAQLREKYNQLLIEKDRWMVDTLRVQQEHQDALAKAEEQRSELRKESLMWQSKLHDVEMAFTDAQRKQYEAEQLAHQYSNKMQRATEEVRDLQRAVASSREVDRQDLERARQDSFAFSNKVTELETDLRAARLRIADLKDEVETSTAMRTSMQQKLTQAQAERDNLLEAKTSLERQLSLAEVEQNALGGESKMLREKITETAKLLTRSEEKTIDLERQLRQALEAAKVVEKNTAASAELSELKDKYQAALVDMQSAMREKAMAMEVVDALRSEARRLHNANESLDVEIGHARSTNDMLAKEIKTLRDELSAASKDFGRVRDEHQRAMTTALADKDKEIATLKRSLETSADALSRLSRELDVERLASEQTRLELKTSVEELTQSLRTRDDQIRELHTEIDRKAGLSPTHVARERQDLEHQRESIADSLKVSQAHVFELKMANDALRLENESAQRALQTEKNTSDKMLQLVRAIAQEAGNLFAPEELPQAMRSLMRERNVAVEEKEKAVADLTSQSVAQHDRIRELRNEVDRLSIQFEKGNDQHIQAEREFARKYGQLERKLEDTVRNCQVQLRQVEDERNTALAAKVGDIEGLSKSLQQMQSALSDSEQRFLAVKAEREQCKLELLRAVQEGDALRQSLAEASKNNEISSRSTQEQQARLEKALRETREQLETVRREKERLQRETEEAALMLATALDEERRLQDAEKDKLTFDADSLRQQLKLERDRRNMEADVNRVSDARIKDLELQIEHLKLEKDQLAREVQTMRKSHIATTDAFQASLSGAENEKKQMQSDLGQLAQALEAAHNRIMELEQTKDATVSQLEELSRQRESALRQLDRFRVNSAGSVGTAAPSGAQSFRSAGKREISPLRQQQLGFDEASRSRHVDSSGGPSSLHGTSPTANRGAPTYSPIPQQQDPLPLPTLSATRGMGNGPSLSNNSARERNDQLLTQFREQRKMSHQIQSSAHPLAVPSLSLYSPSDGFGASPSSVLVDTNRSPVAGGGGYSLGSLRR